MRRWVAKDLWLSAVVHCSMRAELRAVLTVGLIFYFIDNFC